MNTKEFNTVHKTIPFNNKNPVLILYKEETIIYFNKKRVCLYIQQNKCPKHVLEEL